MADEGVNKYCVYNKFYDISQKEPWPNIQLIIIINNYFLSNINLVMDSANQNEMIFRKIVLLALHVCFEPLVKGDFRMEGRIRSVP